MAYAGRKGDDDAFETVDLSSVEMLELLKVSISKKAVFRASPKIVLLFTGIPHRSDAL
jgi:hypothetical protein